MSNAERQKRWREKNRALFNLRRRELRKRLTAVPVLAEPVPLFRDASPIAGKSGEARESTSPIRAGESEAAPGSRGGSQTSTIEKLRELVRVEQEKPRSEAPALPMKPIIYRNDFGNVITEEQWKQLQEKKEEAKQKGYTIDEYSQ